MKIRNEKNCYVAILRNKERRFWYSKEKGLVETLKFAGSYLSKESIRIVLKNSTITTHIENICGAWDLDELKETVSAPKKRTTIVNYLERNLAKIITILNKKKAGDFESLVKGYNSLAKDNESLSTYYGILTREEVLDEDPGAIINDSRYFFDAGEGYVPATKEEIVDQATKYVAKNGVYYRVATLSEGEQDCFLVGYYSSLNEARKQAHHELLDWKKQNSRGQYDGYHVIIERYAPRDYETRDCDTLAYWKC